MNVPISVLLSWICALCFCKKDVKAQEEFITKLKDTIIANFEIKGVSYVATNTEIDNSNILN